jgi:hypothetical protein
MVYFFLFKDKYFIFGDLFAEEINDGVLIDLMYIGFAHFQLFVPVSLHVFGCT